jgi:hypothetical protein
MTHAGDHGPIAVFLGPSCSQAEARSILPQADYFPPAARGSVYRIINDGYRMIVLIDGLFYGQFSVWHKELLFALDCGIDVIGATSMGALRAAELDGAGMVGVGQIYRWYRDGVIDGDDEVALLHQSQEGGYAALTIPLVNLRWNLIRAVAEGVIEPSREAQILEGARALCFQERTMDTILAPLLDQADVHALSVWLGRFGEDLKHRDCLEALHFAAARIRSHSVIAPPRVRPYEYIHARVGIEYFMSERHRSIWARSQGLAMSLAQIKDRIAADDPRFGAYVRARAFQRLVNGWARELHLEIAPHGPAPVWNPGRFDAARLQATGLTHIDIAREGQEAALTAAVLDHISSHQETVVGEIDRKLAVRGLDVFDEGRAIARLHGRLVYALWRLGQEKGIHPDGPLPLKSADAALDFADWIYAGGLQRFGYAFDPATEILLAYQYANQLDEIGLRAAS